MFQVSTLPLRRTDALSFQDVGKETLVYNERSHKAYCLNATASQVWRHCDGTRTPQQLASLVSPEAECLTGETVVRFALAQLATDKLISGYAPAELGGISRRAMLIKGGAGLTLMLPVIAMISASRAAQAYNGCFDCSAAAQQVQEQRVQVVPRAQKIHAAQQEEAARKATGNKD